MMEVLKYTVEGGFWHFVGCYMVIGLCAGLVIKLTATILNVFR